MLPLFGAEDGLKPLAKAALNKPPMRFACIFFSSGVEFGHWWAKGSGESRYHVAIA